MRYWIKIQEGKDRSKYANGKWEFPSKFEGENSNTGRKYTKTSSLMCEMTVPLHGTWEIVSMDSGFCVTVGILHLHEHGVYGQSLIKKQKYWPKGCPGAQIDSYMEGKPLGFVKTLRQDMGGDTFQHTLNQRLQVCYQTDEHQRTTQRSARSFHLPAKKMGSG